MPLSSLFNLKWNGPASGAMVSELPTIEVVLLIKGFARPESTVTVSLPLAFLKATRLVNSPINVNAIGELIQATPKGSAKFNLQVNIGAQPSAFDIAQAVLNALAAQYNIPGTIGAKINQINGAGGGGGGGLTTDQDTKLDELYTIAGLKSGVPMNVNKVTGQRTAGSIVLGITGDDNNNVTVERQ